MDQLGKALAQIAQQLGTTAGHLWPQMVAVTFWECVTWLTMDLVILTAATVFLVTVIRSCSLSPSDSTPEKDSTDDGTLVCCVGFLWLIVVGAVLTTLPGVVAGVLAPEGVTATNLLHDVLGR